MTTRNQFALNESNEDKLYWFPIIAATDEERIKNGVAYHLERGWTQKYASIKADCSVSQIRR